jgi:hypothetical protein
VGLTRYFFLIFIQLTVKSAKKYDDRRHYVPWTRFSRAHRVPATFARRSISILPNTELIPPFPGGTVSVPATAQGEFSACVAIVVGPPCFVKPELDNPTAKHLG